MGVEIELFVEVVRVRNEDRTTDNPSFYGLRLLFSEACSPSSFFQIRSCSAIFGPVFPNLGSG